jgi:hypothetical protein
MRSFRNFTQSLFFAPILALRLLLPIAFLQGCASAVTTADQPKLASTSKATAAKMLTDEFFAPKGALIAAGNQKNKQLQPQHSKLSTTALPQAFEVRVLLYSSLSNKVFFETAGLNVANTIRGWETFLKKYQFSYTQINEVSQLERSTSGLLILPSTVALSMREKQAIVDFRARGGSVLSTWLTGVRDEKGVWQGFDFMEQVLDAKVLGDTSAHKDDNFLLPHGDSPVSNVLLAGERIWLERAKNWLPLKLNGRQVAAQIMDWSRSFDSNKHTGAIVFDERPLSADASSRVVTLAYPERLWQTAEPKQLEAIHHNVLTWLLRLPNAYKSAWPAGARSALLLAVDATEVISESDIAVAKLMDDIGVRATYYTLSDHLAKSTNHLIALQTRGHEIAYMGDSFNGFKGQPESVQATRIDNARKLTRESKIIVPEAPGFHAPTESFDKVTKDLLAQRGFGHYIDTMEASEARLPFLDTNSTGKLKPVVFPRTQRGPEDATEEGDVDDGIQSFLSEYKLSVQMGGIAVVRMPTQSLLPLDDWTKVFAGLNQNREGVWSATASQIAHWWRERERVSVSLRGQINQTELTIEVKGAEAINEPVVVFVNLPKYGAIVRINSASSIAEKVKIVAVDRWRIGLVLNDVPVGSHSVPISITY